MSKEASLSFLIPLTKQKEKLFMVMVKTLLLLFLIAQIKRMARGKNYLVFDVKAIIYFRKKTDYITGSITH